MTRYLPLGFNICNFVPQGFVDGLSCHDNLHEKWTSKSMKQVVPNNTQLSCHHTCMVDQGQERKLGELCFTQAQSHKGWTLLQQPRNIGMGYSSLMPSTDVQGHQSCA